MKDLKGMEVKLKGLIGDEVLINTDEYTIYEGIAEIEGVKGHRVVNHGEKGWEREEVHVKGS